MPYKVLLFEDTASDPEPSYTTGFAIMHFGNDLTNIQIKCLYRGRARSNSKCNILFICENFVWEKNTSTSHSVIGR